jgi:hypothetical protein
MIVNPIAWRLAQARGTQEIIAARLDPDPLRYITWGSHLQILTTWRSQPDPLPGNIKEARLFELQALSV